MTQYRKKPVVIEAFRLGIDNMPDWFFCAVCSNEVTTHNEDGRWRGGPDYALIKTLEGEMRAEYGDWIIQGVKGEIYPCKIDIFDATYEPADLSRTEEAQPVRVPVAFMRTQCSACPGEPIEWDADFSYGDDQPDGAGWVPLYTESPQAPAVSDKVCEHEWKPMTEPHKECVKCGDVRLDSERTAEDAGGDEAVAWMLRIGASDDWSFTRLESDADFYGKQSGLRYEKRPLFSRPAPASKAVGLTLTDSIRAKLIELADELDGELDSGATWTKAQHTCCSVSGALRALAATQPSAEAMTLSDEQRETIREAVRTLTNHAVDLHDSNTTEEGEWCDDDDLAEYQAEMRIIERLQGILAAAPAEAKGGKDAD